MTFNSALFLVFFPLVTGLYFLVAHRWRWVVLLVASCYFYMCFVPVYILILVGMIVIDYIAGILIERSTDSRRKLFLVLSIAANLGVLFVFKYFNFFTSSIADLAAWMQVSYPMPTASILLPIGLSFHTFQSLSYTIEVYRGTQPAERHLGIFALYVMFWPQLVAGPIERPQHMLHQFREQHTLDWGRVSSGLSMMAWGFFMKVVVADRLAIFVNEVYGGVHYFTGPGLLIATVFFAFQIYGDFAGYSLIAIGSAKTMGFTLMENFNRPYSATSIADFWRRWHISLSSWFRDYVYIPLGGNRMATWKIARNVMITFLLSGLWHGANWTYVVWGALNGAYIVIGNSTAQWRLQKFANFGVAAWPHVYRAGQTIGTFALVCVGWVIFRAASLGDAWYVLTHLFTGWGTLATHLTDPYFLRYAIFATHPPLEFVLGLAGIATIIWFEWYAAQQRRLEKPLVRGWFRPAVFAALIFIIFFLGEFKAQQFIYFQF